MRYGDDAVNEYVQALWLAVLQGLTEFLPISSSGHLVLLPHLSGWRDQGLGFDVAVHVGTLLAAVFYFRTEVRKILSDWVGSLVGRPATPHSQLAWAILIATAITGVAGVWFEDTLERALRAPLPVAFATLGFGIVLGLADWLGPKRRSIGEVRWKGAVVLGCAQALALIPGTSRSGITISAGLLLGLTREAAARFSFLMAMPVIALAGAWQVRGLVQSGAPVRWGVLIFATAVSALVALGCIHWFLGFLRRRSLLPFVIYRVLLGVILLLIFL